MSNSPQLGRPSDRKNLIAGQLRCQIVEGQLLPGDRLPTRVEIEQQYQASPGTVQSALEQLRRDGFTVVRGRLGTFVAPDPPHLTNFALVFPIFPGDNSRTWVRFWSALVHEANLLQKAGKRRITCYYAVNEHQDSEDYRALLEQVQSLRLAGIIFATHTQMLQGSPILTEPGIPRVSISSAEYQSNMSRVGTDINSFWKRAFESLKGSGCRRIAVLCGPATSTTLQETAALAAEYGLELPPPFLQGMHLGAPHLARNLVHLLFSGPAGQRPDGFIVADDNLVEHASAGLLASGVQVPKDVKVVVHCNFPWPSASVIPAKRLGFDAREVLLAALSSLERQRGKGNAGPAVSIPALFEDEVDETRFGSERPGFFERF